MLKTTGRYRPVLTALLGCWLAAGSVKAGEPVRRIVSMVPSLTEICFELGCGEKLAGVTDYCQYPPAARKLPRLGGLLNPNLERLAGLQPDLVLLSPDEKRLADQLAGLQIRTLTVPVRNLAELRQAYTTLTTALDAGPAGLAARQRLDDGLRQAAAPAGSVHRPVVLLVVGRTPGELSNIYAASPRTFLGELLELAGGRNAYEGSLLYPSLSLEGISRSAPEVILELVPGLDLPPGRRAELARDWIDLPGVPAVRQRRVFLLDDDFISIPGPRVVKTLQRFRQCLTELPRE